MRHRLVFTGVWALSALALLLYPGFEVRGLAGAVIVGYWPLAWVLPLYHAQPLLCLAVAFLASGLAVWAGAWVMDRLGLPRHAWILLALAAVTGLALGYAAQQDRYEAWTRSPAVTAAMESPEVNYTPTRRDFHERIVIPSTLMFGVWGVYAASGACVLGAVVWWGVRRTTRLKARLAVSP